MSERPKVTLDYSCPASEDKPDRLRAVADYNESTYGERHLYAGPLLRKLTCYVLAFLLLEFLPLPHFLRDLVRPLLLIALGAFEYGRYS